MTAVRVALPAHLCTLARAGSSEVQVDVDASITVDSVLDALETRFPMLRGTIRDHVTGKRRAYMRYFACGADISFEPTDAILPGDVAQGKDAFVVLGAIAGG